MSSSICRVDPEPHTKFDLARERFIELDDDDVRHESEARRVFDCEDEREERERLAAAIEASENPLLEPKIRAKGNTGVKGVINDYMDHRQHVMEEAQRKKDQILRQAERWALSKPISGSVMVDRPRSSNPEGILVNDDEDELAELFGSDEEMFRELEVEFFAEYKAKKMRELLDSVPSFGFYQEIDDMQYADEIDQEHPSTVVVIHLFEESVPDCKWVDHALTQLAAAHPFVKFRRIRASLANARLDHEVLPALLVYKNKDLIQSLFIVGEKARALPRIASTSSSAPASASAREASASAAEILANYLIMNKILQERS